MAAAQTVAVVEAGGRTVSLGSLLGPSFASDRTLFSAGHFIGLDNYSALLHDSYFWNSVENTLGIFVIAGTICGLAGALLANNTDFVSPAGMYWTRSGELMVMVVLGGMGSLFGPVIGAIAFLLLEELLSQVTEYWALIMGPLLLLIVLFGRGGIDGLLGRLRRG